MAIDALAPLPTKKIVLFESLIFRVRETHSENPFARPISSPSMFLNDISVKHCVRVVIYFIQDTWHLLMQKDLGHRFPIIFYDDDGIQQCTDGQNQWDDPHV